MLGIFYNKSDKEYHKWDGHLSSSQLKIILNDPVEFYQRYITKEKPPKEKDCFTAGNAFHTAILEPDKYKELYIALPKDIKVKRGAKWEEFQKENKDKIILGNKNIVEIEQLKKSIHSSKYAMDILLGGKAEVSIYSKLEGLPVKVRFDKLNPMPYGTDLKSTTGELLGKKGKLHCQLVIKELDYDLSAALYVDTYNSIEGRVAKKQGREPIFMKDFWWVFASKDHTACRIFRASELMLNNGRKKYMKAIEEYKKFEAEGWNNNKALSEGPEDIDPIESDLIVESKEHGVKTW